VFVLVCEREKERVDEGAQSTKKKTMEGENTKMKKKAENAEQLGGENRT